MLQVITWVPFALILISVVFCAVPMSLDSETLEAILPITIGAIICIAVGELLTINREKHLSKSY